MTRIAIIGAGHWGTALAIMAARKGHAVHVWSRNAAVVDAINRSHANSAYLEGVGVPDGVLATTQGAVALEGAELVILATPSHATREVLSNMASSLRSEMVFVSATKGLELGTGKRMSQVLNDIVCEQFPPRFVCLSGPSFAKEVIKGHPTAVVAASASSEDRRFVQEALSFEHLRIYSNDDVVGTELCGALKNVMAIAGGMVAGLGFGSNTVAALITRGLAEMSRLALREGARIETMMGLAGLGDLVLTCNGGLSRNRYVGQELGRGRTLAEITNGMNEVAEGVKTTLAVRSLAHRRGVEMPITDQVHEVLYEGKSARAAASELMTRPLREEPEARR